MFYLLGGRRDFVCLYPRFVRLSESWEVLSSDVLSSAKMRRTPRVMMYGMF